MYLNEKNTSSQAFIKLWVRQSTSTRKYIRSRVSMWNFHHNGYFIIIFNEQLIKSPSSSFPCWGFLSIFFVYTTCWKVQHFPSWRTTSFFIFHGLLDPIEWSLLSTGPQTTLLRLTNEVDFFWQKLYKCKENDKKIILYQLIILQKES